MWWMLEYFSNPNDDISIFSLQLPAAPEGHQGQGRPKVQAQGIVDTEEKIKIENTSMTADLQTFRPEIPHPIPRVVLICLTLSSTGMYNKTRFDKRRRVRPGEASNLDDS
jgi:hypothetical protein